jgi:hypothetical protein
VRHGREEKLSKGADRSAVPLTAPIAVKQLPIQVELWHVPKYLAKGGGEGLQSSRLSELCINFESGSPSPRPRNQLTENKRRRRTVGTVEGDISRVRVASRDLHS